MEYPPLYRELGWGLIGIHAVFLSHCFVQAHRQSWASLEIPSNVPNSQSLSSQITNTWVYTLKKETFWYVLSGLSMSSLVEDSRPDHALRQTSLNRSPYSTVSHCCVPHKVQDWKTLFRLDALDTRSQKKKHSCVLKNVRLNGRHEARTAPRHAHSEIPESML